MFVETWMTTPVATIAGEATVAEAWGLMSEKRIRRLPVVGPDGKLIGMLTRSDLMTLFGLHPDNDGPVQHWSTPVEKAMTRDPVTAAPKDALESAATKMLEKKISGLPVVEDGEPVGMITESDIFKAFVKVLGADETGARVDLRLTGDGSLLDAVSKAARGYGVRSVVTYRDPRSGATHALVRLRGKEK